MVQAGEEPGGSGGPLPHSKLYRPTGLIYKYFSQQSPSYLLSGFPKVMTDSPEYLW